MGGDTEAQSGTVAPKLPCKVRQHPDSVSQENPQEAVPRKLALREKL